MGRHLPNYSGINSKFQMKKDMDLYMPVKPITPKEVTEKKKELIPSEVIEAFNEMIAQNYSVGVASFTQDEVLKLAVSKLQISRIVDGEQPPPAPIKSEIFNKHWFDIEEIYEKAGWKVEYDKTAYNETGPDVFRFTKKRTRS